MDTIELRLISNRNGTIDLNLQSEEKGFSLDLLSGKEVVFEDNEYTFCINATYGYPISVCINEDIYDVEITQNRNGDCYFKLLDCPRPFLHLCGGVKLSLTINGVNFTSKRLPIMVTNTSINRGAINMLQYIYDNCEDYLFKETADSSSDLLGNKKEMTLADKIEFMKNSLTVYKACYQRLKANPYHHLKKEQIVDSFDKLQTISSATVRYIATHSDDLTAVNYDTGISYNNQYYQPNRILIERNTYSLDNYENRTVLGFLKTVVRDINQLISQLQALALSKATPARRIGYIDSMYELLSKSIEKVSSYVTDLNALKNEYQQLYFFFVRLFNMEAEPVTSMPVFTMAFQSVIPYRQIYQVISKWFSITGCDLGRETLFLGLVSTSAIYEYYCLVKMLHYLDVHSDYTLVESKKVEYQVTSRYVSYVNTVYNNTFIFTKGKRELVLYFQPVIYGNTAGFNEIMLMRNTSANPKSESLAKGTFYTPDYLIKISEKGVSKYFVIDAKYSSPDNIRIHQMRELVFKYLFSISPLNSTDKIGGMYIMSGKNSDEDEECVVHDLALQHNVPVKPFAEIVKMSGYDTSDYTMPMRMFALMSL